MMTPPVERRKVPRLTIGQILQKMRQISQSKYEGDTMSHAVTIFRQLLEEEQQTFLRHSINLINEQLLEERTAVVCPVLPESATIDIPVLQEELDEIERSNQIENIRFRSFFLKLVMIVAFVFFLGFFGYVIYITSHAGNNDSFLSGILEWLWYNFGEQILGFFGF